MHFVLSARQCLRLRTSGAAVLLVPCQQTHVLSVAPSSEATKTLHSVSKDLAHTVHHGVWDSAFWFHCPLFKFSAPTNHPTKNLQHLSHHSSAFCIGTPSPAKTRAYLPKQMYGLPKDAHTPDKGFSSFTAVRLMRSNIRACPSA